MFRITFFLALALFFLVLSPAAFAQSGTLSHGMAMHGDLKYPRGFKNFAYVNPNAPKGGTLRLYALGTFDSLNPFILKGTPAAGLNALGQGLIYESLMTQSEDEPFSMYGLVAESVDLAPDRSRVTFHINPKAKWHDGTPITASDVKWTFETLMTSGAPFYKSYFGDVKEVNVEAPSRVTFTSKNPSNRELPLVLSQMVVLPQHYWTAKGRDITKGTLDSPVGSGPYKIGTIKPGASIEYVRADTWWGTDLPVNRGRYNFDRITYDYYRDQNVSLEAFFAGNYDVRQESFAKLWTTAYTAPSVADGRIVKKEIPHSQPVGMQGFIFNLRRPMFEDVRVREAFDLAFDYEWSNRQLAFGAYTRSDSFFENSDLGASGLPSAAEITLLEPFRAKVPEQVFTTVFAPPKSDGSGRNRENLRRAAELLDQAGYKVDKDGVRTNEKTGAKVSVEFLEANEALERWINPWILNLKKIGIQARLRLVDPTQYQNRMEKFDYDVTSEVIGQSDSPGNEQMNYWHSTQADVNGSRNLIGIKNPVVDKLVTDIITAPTRADLVARTRALDRVLLWNHYLVPGWHYAKWRVAWWDKFGRPDGIATKSLGVEDTWWSRESEKKE